MGNLRHNEFFPPTKGKTQNYLERYQTSIHNLSIFHHKLDIKKKKRLLTKLKSVLNRDVNTFSPKYNERFTEKQQKDEITPLPDSVVLSYQVED